MSEEILVSERLAAHIRDLMARNADPEIRDLALQLFDAFVREGKAGVRRLVERMVGEVADDTPAQAGG